MLCILWQLIYLSTYLVLSGFSYPVLKILLELAFIRQTFI